MARSTGPILAMGGVTLFNESIIHDQPLNLRVVIATGGLALVFDLLERASSELAIGLAWVGLVAILFTRINASVPSPVESAMAFWNEGKS